MSEPLFEQVRNGLRASYRDGYCPKCGRADPDDDDHRIDCVFADAFDALWRIEDVELAAAREFIRYVRDGNVGHISDEGIEWADRLLAASAPEEPQA